MYVRLKMDMFIDESDEGSFEGDFEIYMEG